MSVLDILRHAIVLIVLTILQNMKDFLKVVVFNSKGSHREPLFMEFLASSYNAFKKAV
jgi:hypothetical protein